MRPLGPKPLAEPSFSITSPLPYFVLVAVFLLLSSSIAKRIPFFENLYLQKSAQPSYFTPLEGLRGLLALSVFFHHGLCNYFYFQTGEWPHLPRFYELIGSVSVTLFFFLTAFLFWRKMLRAHAPPRARSFYLARIRRLYPAYLASFLLILIIVIVRTKAQVQESIPALFGHLLNWLIMGVPEGTFSDLNGLTDTRLINAGVFWTLRYEALFYLALPLLYRFVSGSKLLYVLVPFLLIYLTPDAYMGNFLGRIGHFMSVGFAWGMIAATIFEKVPAPLWARSRKASLMILAVLIAVFCSSAESYSLSISVPLLFPFLCIAWGNDMFGLLRTRACFFLGSISYSVYLVHGIALSTAARVINQSTSFGALTSAQFWIFMLFCGCAVLLLSALSFRFIEFPFSGKKS